MIQFGNDKIKDIYVGSDKIKEVYYGSEKVWESIQKGYWVHKDTGVITYFDLTDPSIKNGIMYKPSWSRDCSEVKIPFGVTDFGSGCFSSNTSLTSIILPKSITSISPTCFYNCTSLTSINIPEGVTTILQDSFRQCTSLTSITLPESVTSLGLRCFQTCSALTLLTVLPAIPPTLGSDAFRGVPWTIDIKVRPPYVNAYKTATNWTEYASKISAITEGYWMHKDTKAVTFFDAGADFITDGIMNPPSWRYDCFEVNIPEGVTSLEESCFSHCSSLTHITLPEGVTSLEYNCFSYCTSLTSITLPESVTSIGAWCFHYCGRLALATVLPAIPPTLGGSIFFNANASLNIKVRSPYVNAYKTATNWTEYASKISAI